MRGGRFLVAAAVVAGALSLAGASSAAAAPGPCAWPLKSDPDTLNLAYPDESATYWVAPLPAAPAGDLLIRGRYPRARYFSFHAYDPSSRPVDGIADLQIAPDPGGSNPFRERRASAGDRYTVRVDFGERPERRSPNTLYAGRTREGVANPLGALIYRVYVPDDPSDPRGGVPLPEISLDAGGGQSLEFQRCEPLPPSTGGALNREVRDASFPEGAPRVVPHPTAQDPPRWSRFFGLAGGGGGFFSNEHIAYGILALSRQFGDLVVLRARAPSFPDTRAGERVTVPSQLRYWSLCQNELATQRFVDCAADHQVALDRRRFFTVVISDPADRPRNATRANDVTWLPWGGPYYDGLVIYRHMLPAARFGGAWQRVEQGADPARVMRRYYPRAAYCPTAAFERRGWRGCLGR